jgi:AcrR family transcriptional regulator
MRGDGDGRVGGGPAVGTERGNADGTSADRYGEGGGAAEPRRIPAARPDSGAVPAVCDGEPPGFPAPADEKESRGNPRPGPGAGPVSGLVHAAVRRPLEARWAAYAEEVTRLVDATYRVVERTGSLDPTVREILREAGLSNQAFYRHFRSKDELLVALLDDGRRRMADYLRHRMAAASDPAGRVRAWIEGVLAQAGDRAAAARTRPFLSHQDRLAERFPAEQRDSAEAMLAPLRDVLAAAYGGAASGGAASGGAGEAGGANSAGSAADAAREPGAVSAAAADALAVYRLTVACLHDHLRSRTAPDAAEIGHVVEFALRGLRLPQADDGTG